MFRLPIIGVRACASTGHALSPLVVEARLRFMRAGVQGMSPIVVTQRLPSSAASSPLRLFPRIARSHHSAHRALALPGGGAGPRRAMAKRHGHVIRSSPCREPDALPGIRGGEIISFGGVKSQVPEVLHP